MSVVLQCLIFTTGGHCDLSTERSFIVLTLAYVSFLAHFLEELMIPLHGILMQRREAESWLLKLWKTLHFDDKTQSNINSDLVFFGKWPCYEQVDEPQWMSGMIPYIYSSKKAARSLQWKSDTLNKCHVHAELNMWSWHWRQLLRERPDWLLPVILVVWLAGG